jgi:glutaredoxin
VATLLGVRLMAVAAAAGGLAGGCGEDPPSSDGAAALAAAVAPAPLVVAAQGPELVFRYVDPDSGKVATAMAATDVPAAAARQVIVMDPAAPATPGWEQVVDLSAGLPATATPTRGFVLQPRVTAPAAPPATAADVGKPKVDLFVRAGCGFCRKARQWLTGEHIAFTEHDLDADPQAAKVLQKLARKAGLSAQQLSGVPIIFVGSEAVLGFDRPRLERLLKG